MTHDGTEGKGRDGTSELGPGKQGELFVVLNPCCTC
jgi:hypothetical protein